MSCDRLLIADPASRSTSRTMVGLHQHSGSHGTGEFCEYRPGLDHLAFGCESRAHLEQRVERLDALEVAHGGIVDAHYGSGLSFRDPDASPSNSSRRLPASPESSR